MTINVYSKLTAIMKNWQKNQLMTLNKIWQKNQSMTLNSNNVCPSIMTKMKDNDK